MYNRFKSDLQSELITYNIEASVIDTISIILAKLSTTYDIVAKPTELVPYVDNSPIIKRYYAIKRIEGVTEAALANQLKTISQFFDFIKKPVDQVLADDIRYFIMQYVVDRNIQLSTADKYQGYLCTFFKWCFNEEYIHKDITYTIKPIKHEQFEKMPLSVEELNIIRDSCETLRDRAMVETFFALGCRVSELCGLKKSDFNLTTNLVRIFGKGRKERHVPISANAMSIIHDYWNSRKDDCEYAFVTARGARRLDRGTVYRIIKKLEALGNIQTPLSPHVLRHTTATIALSNGMPIQEIQKLLGHSQISTTQRYAKVNFADLQTHYNKIMNSI